MDTKTPLSPMLPTQHPPLFRSLMNVIGGGPSTHVDGRPLTQRPVTPDADVRIHPEEAIRWAQGLDGLIHELEAKRQSAVA